MGAEAYTWVTKYKKNLADALAAARMGLLCFVCLFPVATMAQEPELCIDPQASLPEILKTAEIAVSRLEKLPSKTFIRFGQSASIKANAKKDIAYLDEQLLRFLILQQAEERDALELKWRQYPTGCRDKRILILLCDWNKLPDNFDAIQPEGRIQYWNLSAWDSASKEYKKRREEIEYVRKNGRVLHERIQAMLQRGYKQNRQWLWWIFGGGAIWWLLCIVIEPHLREKIDGQNFPTKASFVVRWMGILGFIVILGIGLFFQIFNGSKP